MYWVSRVVLLKTSTQLGCAAQRRLAIGLEGGSVVAVLVVLVVLVFGADLAPVRSEVLSQRVIRFWGQLRRDWKPVLVHFIEVHHPDPLLAKGGDAHRPLERNLPAIG